MADVGEAGSADGSSLLKLLKDTRSVSVDGYTPSGHILSDIKNVAKNLQEQQKSREAEALLEAYQHCITGPDFGGLGLSDGLACSEQEVSEVLFFISAYLEALNYQDRNSAPTPALPHRPPGRRGMTLAEKIFAAHDVARRGEVRPGDVIRLDVDWVIASELSWYGMEKTYNALGKPGIFRNDRLWIAGDHVVDPRVLHMPQIKPLVESSERARRVFKLTEYQGMNYTIMHTEFCRERAEPGMLIIGSDSHTCSAGSVSSLAIGLGVADVTLPLVTGETWIKVPETVEIRFINRPKPGMGGKDIILYVLKELKRNTVAADRVVEYTGPGLQYLSCDARFAFCNMTTEFGGITGICVPDAITKRFIDKRKNAKHKKQTVYYQPDADAQYAESHTIDLAQVEPFVARYPSPDDVVPVSEMAGTQLDGCFIGACTTAREDLVLAALVLEAGLKLGKKPVGHGKRKVVPGSRPILHELEERGLADIYRQAGFEIGVPGCSYCVGMSADKAGKGEVWLSSQNRNFENRMGPGAIGSITAAVTVAASSFDMVVTDPTLLLDSIDRGKLDEILLEESDAKSPPRFVEPGFRETEPDGITREAEAAEAAAEPSVVDAEPARPSRIAGKVQTLGDFIDTDALAPAEALLASSSEEDFGKYCLYHTHPDFRRLVKEENRTVVVAGRAFGVGSSRENAVSALRGAGVKCVIARSFAFIYARNQPNLGLLGIVMEDEEFYRLATDGAPIEVSVDERTIRVGNAEFSFTLSDLEIQLWQQGGMGSAFARWGKELLERMTARKSPAKLATTLETLAANQLNW